MTDPREHLRWEREPQITESKAKAWGQSHMKTTAFRNFVELKIERWLSLSNIRNQFRKKEFHRVNSKDKTSEKARPSRTQVSHQDEMPSVKWQGKHFWSQGWEVGRSLLSQGSRRWIEIALAGIRQWLKVRNWRAGSDYINSNCV